MINNQKIKYAMLIIFITVHFLIEGCLVAPGVNPTNESNGETILVVNPYENVEWNNIKQVRTNTHTHVYDHGSAHPHELVDWYSYNGYGALAITEHNYVIYPWEEFSVIEPPNEPPPANNPWENRSPKEVGMIAIPGNEIGDSDHHRVSLFNTYNPNDYDGHDSEDKNLVFEEILKHDGIVYWAHPGRYWKVEERYGPEDKYSPEWYINYFNKYPLKLLVGIEVYSGRNKYPNDRILWDILLKELMPDRPVWGFGADDLHGAGYLGQSYTRQLLSEDEFNQESLKQAMIEGRFYTSYAYRGWTDAIPPNRTSITPRIERIVVSEDNKSITIQASEYQYIRWISGVDGELENRESRVVATGKTFYYDNFKDNYIRAEIIGINDSNVEQNRTLTNPFGFKILLK